MKFNDILFQKLFKKIIIIQVIYIYIHESPFSIFEFKLNFFYTLFFLFYFSICLAKLSLNVFFLEKKKRLNIFYNYFSDSFFFPRLISFNIMFKLNWVQNATKTKIDFSKYSVIHNFY